MKKNNFTFKTFMLATSAFAILTLTSCKDDDPAAAINIVSINAVGTDLTTGNEVTIDLNGTASATDVPINSVIAVTFDRDLDASTINSTTVVMSNGTTETASTTTVMGAVVTVTGASDLEKGTVFTLLLTSEIKASDGGSFVESTRTFKTAGKAPGVIPQSDKVVVHVSFDGAVTDANNHTILVDDVTYAINRFGEVESAGDFNGTTNYVGVEYAADMVNASNTVSYWIKVPTSSIYDEHIRKNRFVTYSIGGNQGSFQEWGRFDCCGFTFDLINYMTNHVNSGTNGGFIERWNESKQEGSVPGGDLTYDRDNKPWLEDNTGEWLHVVTTYDAAQSRKAVYTNGVLGTAWVFEASEDGTSATGDFTLNLTNVDADLNNNRNLYIGSGLAWWGQLQPDGFSIIPDRSGPHAFKGQMDDFRMFSVALTDAEVLQLYETESPE